MKFLSTLLIVAFLIIFSKSAIWGGNLQVENCAFYKADGSCQGCYYK